MNRSYFRVFYVERAYRTPDYGIWERGNKINHGMEDRVISVTLFLLQNNLKNFKACRN
jgi:hypothetical protein